MKQCKKDGCIRRISQQLLCMAAVLCLVTIGGSLTESYASQTKAASTEGLVAYYPFNGNANDESGNGNHATINGAILTEDNHGNANSAYSLDGVNDYISIPYNSSSSLFNLENRFTYSLWFYANASGELTINQPLIGRQQCQKAYPSAELDLLKSEIAFTLNYQQASTHSQFIPSQTVIPNQWMHIAATYDKEAGQVKIYLNGENILSDSYSQTIWKPATPFWIGGIPRPDGSSSCWETFFNGNIDNIRIYNRALSESEIEELYNSEGEESPEILPPTATTGNASSLTANSATLNGTVNPNGTSTTYYFQYGTSSSYGSNTTSQNAGAGNSSSSVTANITGLSANTTYHFRLVATNSAGTVYGSDMIFYIGDSSVNLTDGLVAYYPFNGNANDESGKGHHGTVTGATLTTDRNGNANSAYNFDGVDDVIKTLPVNWDLSSKATVCAWIKAPASSYSGAILSISHDYAEDEILFGPVWQGYMSIFNHKSSGNYNVLSAADISNDSQWHFIVGQFNGGGQCGNLSLFVDGVEQSGTCSGSAPDIIDTIPRILHIGSRTEWAGSLFSGMIDDIRIYNRTLSESEIEELYNSEGGDSPEILLPTATTGTASSITANSATLNGTVNPNGTSTNYYFEYGIDTNYGAVTAVTESGQDSTEKNVSANLTGLNADTTYHFRLVATNSAGTTNGRDQTFKTTESEISQIDVPINIDESNIDYFYPAIEFNGNFLTHSYNPFGAGDNIFESCNLKVGVGGIRIENLLIDGKAYWLDLVLNMNHPSLPLEIKDIGTGNPPDYYPEWDTDLSVFDFKLSTADVFGPPLQITLFDVGIADKSYDLDFIFDSSTGLFNFTDIRESGYLHYLNSDPDNWLGVITSSSIPPALNFSNGISMNNIDFFDRIGFSWNSSIGRQDYLSIDYGDSTIIQSFKFNFGVALGNYLNANALSDSKNYSLAGKLGANISNSFASSLLGFSLFGKQLTNSELLDQCVKDRTSANVGLEANNNLQGALFDLAFAMFKQLKITNSDGEKTFTAVKSFISDSKDTIAEMISNGQVTPETLAVLIGTSIVKNATSKEHEYIIKAVWGDTPEKNIPGYIKELAKASGEFAGYRTETTYKLALLAFTKGAVTVAFPLLGGTAKTIIEAQKWAIDIMADMEIQAAYNAFKKQYNGNWNDFDNISTKINPNIRIKIKNILRSQGKSETDANINDYLKNTFNRWYAQQTQEFTNLQSLKEEYMKSHSDFSRVMRGFMGANATECEKFLKFVEIIGKFTMDIKSSMGKCKYPPSEDQIKTKVLSMLQYYTNKTAYQKEKLIFLKTHECLNYENFTPEPPESGCYFKEGNIFDLYDVCLVGVNFKGCTNFTSGGMQVNIPFCFTLGSGGTIIPKASCSIGENWYKLESLTGSWSCNSINLDFVTSGSLKTDPYFMDCWGACVDTKLKFTGTATITADSSGKLTSVGSGNVSQTYNYTNKCCPRTADGTVTCEKPFKTQ